MKISKIGWLLLTAMWFNALQLIAADIFVAVDGDDQNPGTSAQPVATLRHARDLARKLGDQPRRILIQPGTYYDVSVELTSKDSGLIIEGSLKGRVTLAGGELISGWAAGANGWLTTSLPSYPVDKLDFPTKSKNWEIRSLSVNKEWRRKSRYPDSGYLTNLNIWNVANLGNVGGRWQRKPTDEESSTVKYRVGDIPADLNILDADVTVYHVWNDAFGRIVSNDTARGELHLSPPGPEPPGAFGVHEFVLWNTAQGMTRPGQWYHERGPHRLNYIPRADENTGNIQVLAPVALTIIGIHGTAAEPARNIVLRHLSFTSATVSIGSGGAMETDKEGAVTLSHAQHCTLNGLTFQRVSGWGIQDRGGNRMNLLEQCTAEECGAGGFVLNGDDTSIRNNTVMKIGLDFPGGSGIVYHGSNSGVVSNRVEDCTYIGIHAGGGTNVEVAWNTVSNALTRMQDGGGIYTTLCTNFFIHNNFVTKIREGGGIDGWGIYLDEHSFLARVEHNLVTHTPYGFLSHISFTNTIRDNIFSSGTDLELAFSRSGEITFNDNILSAPGRLRVRVPETGQHWNRNILGQVPRQTAWTILNQYATVREDPVPSGAVTVPDAVKVAQRTPDTARAEAERLVASPSFEVPSPESVGRKLP